GIGVWILVYRGVRISTEAGVVLGAFEIVVFLALAITLIISAGSNNTLSVFNPSTGNANGWGSVFAGMVYTVLAFIGFEASVPLAEETRDPRRTLPRAVLLSCVLIGVFYLICYYGAREYFGPNVAGDPTKGVVACNGRDPWDWIGARGRAPVPRMGLLRI